MREQRLLADGFGAWRSLASALDWGSRGRRFKSCRPDWLVLAGFVDDCYLPMVGSASWKQTKTVKVKR